MRWNDPDFLNYLKLGGMDLTERYGIPKVKAVRFKDISSAKFLGFNYCTSPNSMQEKHNHFIHFYLPDHYIERVWDNLDHYEAVFSAYRGIVQPDFSLYTNMPLAMQIWQHYRRNWVAQWYQNKGLTVIPAPTWGTEDTFGWCFEGMPKKSCLAVSTIGCMQNSENKLLLYKGIPAMIEHLKPVQLILYGAIDDGIREMIYGIPYVHLESEQRVRMRKYDELRK